MAARIQLRLTAYEKRALEQVASQNNQSLSDFLRSALNEIIADCRDGSPILKLRKNYVYSRPSASALGWNVCSR
jgi:uncharacterized protein (DUF1778 family)